MAIEIERRFLVRDPQAAVSDSGVTGWCGMIRQGYLGWVDGLRIRVRTITDGSGKRSAVLTLKGRRQGIWREEYEHPLGLDRAEQILGALPPTRIVCKTRYRLRYRDGLVWSIDLFEGPNAGLIIAEVDLADPEQRIELPSWVGEEITFNPRYGNSRWHDLRSELGSARGHLITNAADSPLQRRVTNEPFWGRSRRDPRRTTRCRVRGLRLRNPAFRSRHRTIWDRRSGLAQCRTSCRDSVGRAADRLRAALQ
jgi:adenylate cyclase